MKTIRIMLLAVFGAAVLSAVSSRGQVLDLTGATLEGSLADQTMFNSGSAANDGMISTWVINDSTLDSHGYIFIYQLENGGPDDITGINFNNFNSSQFISSISCSNVINGTLSGSLTPSVTLTPNFTFDTITAGGAATFNGDLGMNKVGWFIAVYTDVTSFSTGYALAQDDYQDHGLIDAPNAAVYTTPEPSSAILLLAGFACFYAILRWRRAME